jgi:ComF family protein
MQSLNPVKQLFEKSLNIICPCRCICCGMNACSDDIPVCGECIGTLYKMLNTPCPSCGRMIGSCDCDGELAFLFWYMPGEAHRIVGYIKNDADKRMIRFFAELLMLRIKQLHKKPFEAVTYVPRRKKGIRTAGYDQAKLLAEGVAEVLGIRCVAMLKRHGSEEQKLLSASERRASMKNRYSVIKENILSESREPFGRVLLIDDVCTTGATLDACSALLRKAGIKQVIPAVITKTPKKEGWMTTG